MLTMCERRWSRDIHHHVQCRGGEEEGFGLLVLLNCYVSDLSKEVASHWRHGRDTGRKGMDLGRRAEASKQEPAGWGVWGKSFDLLPTAFAREELSSMRSEVCASVYTLQ
jgi:hypothetical protein